MEVGSKRKRDLGCPRITYHAPGRTFDRLFREDSLQQLEEVVRKKLAVKPDVTICLAQIRDDVHIDLEDEDDFDAFYNAVHSSSAACIRIILKDKVTSLKKNTQGSEEAPERKKRKLVPENAPPLPPTEPPSQVPDPPETTTESRPARKRGASIVQPQVVSNTVEVIGEAGPPAKRPKNAPATSDLVPRTNQPPKQSESHKTTTASELPVPEPLSLPPSLPPNTVVQKTAGVEKKSTKPKSKKAVDTPLPGSALAAIQAKHGEIHESQGKEKVDKMNKEKIESVVSGESEKRQSQTDNAKEPITSEKTSETTNQTPSQFAQPRLVKKAAVKHPERNLSEKEIKGKGKRTKSAAKDAVLPNSKAQEKIKKVVKSSSKVQEASTVNSETSNAVTTDTESGDHITAISRSIIEKYLAPSPPVVAVGISEGPSAIQSASEVQKVPGPSKAICPYCGKALKHDRSRCPVIRAKSPKVIEDRIAKLRLDNSEDPEGVRAHTIEVLEAAAERKFGAKTQKSSNVTPLGTTPSVEHVSSGRPAPSIPHKGSKTDPTANFSHSVRQSSPSSSDSSSEEDPPSQRASSSLSLAIERSFSTSYFDPRNSTRPVSPIQDEGGPKSTSAHVSQPRKGNNGAKKYSQSGGPPSGTPDTPESVFAEPGDDGSDTSVSSGNESTFPQAPPRSKPDLQASLPSFADVTSYSDKDLEALIRGPRVPFTSADLPSSSTSPESSDDEGPEGDQVEGGSEQDEPEDRTRNVRQAFIPSDDSSDESADTADEIQDEELHPHSTLIPVPPAVALLGELAAEAPCLIPKLSHGSPSFQRMDIGLNSPEPDKTGNQAFEDVLAQENSRLGLSRHESGATILEAPRASNQLGIAGTTKEPEPVEDSDGMDFRNGHAPDDASAQSPGSVFREVAENLETEALVDVQSPDLLEPTQVGSSHTPSAPPDPPQEEPARASTPKPGIMQRMKNRVGLASPAKKPLSSSLPTVTPNTKLPRAAIATLRPQRKPRTRSQNDESDQEEDTVAAGGKPISKRETATAPTKPTSARSKLPENNLEVVVDQSKPMPRRSSRAASKLHGTSSHTGPIVSANSLPLRKTRRSKFSEPEEPMKAPQPQSGKTTKESEQLEGSTIIARSPSSIPRNREATPVAPEAQLDDQAQEITLPPSPPVSLHAWETLEAETPVGTTQSDPMVDELHSDLDPIPFPLKPQYQRKASSLNRKHSVSQRLQSPENQEEEGEKENEGNNTLLIPIESQTPFPHPKVQTLAPTDSSDSENEVQNVVAAGRHSTQPELSRYRRLSDFANQATKLFTPRILRQSTRLPQPATVPAKRTEKRRHLYGNMGKHDSQDEVSDYDTESDSDSETENASHIPKSRKAGAGLKGRASVL